MSSKIIYTKTDEAPALATESLLPIIQAFTKNAGIEMELKDISLAGRILANFPEFLSKEQKVEDALTELGKITLLPEANIIKLPNISASIPQLKEAITELQKQGFPLPDYPENPKTPEEKDIQNRYSKISGSAVNPILREGNSDRRVANAVKQYAKDNPHSMGKWDRNSKSHVSSMTSGDFYGSEQSTTVAKKAKVKIEFTSTNNTKKALKENLSVSEGEVIDASVMNLAELKKFFLEQVADAKTKDVLFSVHLKATMMKVSDPIMFGQALEAYFAPVFAKFADALKKIGVDSRLGLADLLEKIQSLPVDQKKQIEDEIASCQENGPSLAMVDSNNGITNLHVPSDVIVDASMPAAIRSSGKMWDAKGDLKDMKAIIPDRCYAGIYQVVIDFCKANGAFDPKTMGNVANVGLMAQKAEEYGSHDKTFWIEEDGQVQVIDQESGAVYFAHTVHKGDIWRMCQTKDVAITDWVKLAVNRARATGNPAIFWLDPNRAHDRQLTTKVESILSKLDTKGLDIQILSPIEATLYTLQRVRAGQDTISVTGNVLRDYLTDLFPILELGTSAKMLSIVPLLAGGGLYETGAGGSAPKHVEQFASENHLRWDSLGEFLALQASLEDLGQKQNSSDIKTLARALDQANIKILKNNRTPSRNVRELDNRGTHFYLTLYWAEAMAEQNDSPQLKKPFAEITAELKSKENVILNELSEIQGQKVEMGGYYNAPSKTLSRLMRPSKTFNQVIEKLNTL